MTRPNTFAGAALDRAGARRTDEEWVARQRSHPAARAVVVSEEGPFVDCSSDPCRPALVPLPRDAPDPVLLGLDAEGPLFAIEGGSVEGARTAMSLRDAGARLSQEDGGLLAYAAAILRWHRNHPFCARCGNPTEMAEAGHVRRCPRCDALHHPRTDPVVIMLVHDGDRALLGRQARWPAGRYSTLAGFVEPGESLEEAVAREVAEEAGVAIGDIRYRSSQPWPFPASLMVGFHARWTGGDPSVGDQELEDVRWFARAEIESARNGQGEIHLPPPQAIARRLIDEWLEDTDGDA